MMSKMEINIPNKGNKTTMEMTPGTKIPNKFTSDWSDMGKSLRIYFL